LAPKRTGIVIMQRRICSSAVLSALVMLGGCGGGDGSSSGASGSAPATPPRGELLTNPPQKLTSYSSSDLLGLLGASPLGKLLLSQVYSPTCSVDIYQLEYETVGGQGEATTASGALMVPGGSSASCTGPRPVVLYAHGTNTDRSFNIAAISDSQDGEGLILAAVFAAQGYIVVAPNYAGYDTSSLPYHPYLNADQQSMDMTDSLTAARTALTAVSAASAASDNHQLYITGYSQGGFVALATERALEAAGATVTAAAPMSGPYALAAFGDALFAGEVTLGAPANLALLTTSYQHAYSNVYATATDMFEPAYASGIESLLPSTTAISALYAEGKLPQSQLFSATPPAPQYAALTPATMPADLAGIFAMGFGPQNLVTNDYRQSYLEDAQAHPDGGFPTTTTGLPADMPGFGLRQDLKLNDLRGYTPSAPTLLCAGNEDPTVLFLNTELLQGYWAAHSSSAPVTVVDIDSAPTSADPYADLKNGFAVAKAAVAAAAVLQGATDLGLDAVLEAYHAGLVPPFCLSAAKTFFDQT
jgi:dienelactone hydrolase